MIIHPLRYVCELSLSQGCFPHELKVSKIIPLYKSGDKTLFNNYRPISLLPLFSKVLERLMYDRLYSFLVKYSILYSFQFGFRKAHSTYMALTCMLDKLHNALERGEYAIGIFIDFRKAFDTVDHGILLYKLYHYGVRGAAYDWFCDYLINRTQLVSYHNTQSNYADISCGVPQGSILGPLYIYIYIYIGRAIRWYNYHIALKFYGHPGSAAEVPVRCPGDCKSVNLNLANLHETLRWDVHPLNE